MRWRMIAGLAVVALLLAVGWPSLGHGPASLAAEAQAGGVPGFEVDPSWPSMPSDWVLGQVSSVTVDANDQVWVLHRPRTVAEDQGVAAPPVLAFDQDGTFIRAWGGPADGYDWPANEHGIHVDRQGNVWVGGNGAQPESDDMLLKFTPEGDLLLQIGGRARSTGNRDTENLMRPAESFVHAAANEVFVADGYGNRRVIVLDADTGAFKRMWGAFGNAPLDPSQASGAPPGEFQALHHLASDSDGNLYTAKAQRGRRVQKLSFTGMAPAR